MAASGLRGGERFPGGREAVVDGAVSEAVFVGSPAEVPGAPTLVGAALAGPELTFHVRDLCVAEIAPRVYAHDLHDAGEAHIEQSLEKHQAGSFALIQISANGPGDGHRREKKRSENPPSAHCLRQVSPPFSALEAKETPVWRPRIRYPSTVKF